MFHGFQLLPAVGLQELWAGPDLRLQAYLKPTLKWALSPQPPGHCSGLPPLAVALAAASFFIFASAAFLVHPHQRNEFIPERLSLAAAVSNVIYHAPPGKVYAGYWRGSLS
jgi:hypothetical protein